MENTRVQQTSGNEKLVMKSMTYDLYWPGTNIFKTKNNAFNWKGKESLLMQDSEMKNINFQKTLKLNLKLNANKNITYR